MNPILKNINTARSIIRDQVNGRGLRIIQPSDNIWASKPDDPLNGRYKNKNIYTPKPAKVERNWLEYWPVLPIMAAPMIALGGPAAIAAGDKLAATAGGRAVTSGLNFLQKAASNSKWFPWADAGLSSAFAGYGADKIRRGDIHNVEDAIEIGLDLLPLTQLAKPVVSTAGRVGSAVKIGADKALTLFNSPLTGKWTKIGNREYRLSPNSLGVNGSPLESRKIGEYSTGIDLNKMHSIFKDYEKSLYQYKGLKDFKLPEYHYELPEIDFNNLVKDDFVDYLSQQTGRTLKRVPIKDTKHGDIYNEGFAFIDENGKEVAYIAGTRKKGKNVWVESSFVDPEFRYQGLGKQMYFDLNNHVFGTYGTTLHSDPMQRVGSTGVGMSPSNRLWKSLREKGWSSVEGEGFNRYDVMAEPSKITTAYGTPAAPRITAENAASMTPAQWTAAQDAAIARGDMAEAQRLRDLHFKVSAPNTKITEGVYHGSRRGKDFNSFDLKYFGYTDGGTGGYGHYFGPLDHATTYTNPRKFYLNIENPYTGKHIQFFNRDSYFRDNELFGRIPSRENAIRYKEGFEKYKDEFAGKDGVIDNDPIWGNLGPVYTVPRGEQIKLADAVTYDDNGVRVPLGERDNFKLNDIRYGLLPFIGLGTLGTMYGTSNK